MLDANSTHAEVVAQYRDNADFDLEGSIEKAKRYIQALRFLLEMRPRETGRGAERVMEAPEILQAKLKEAEAWWRANDPNARAGFHRSHVRMVNLEGYRR